MASFERTSSTQTTLAVDDSPPVLPRTAAHMGTKAETVVHWLREPEADPERVHLSNAIAKLNPVQAEATAVLRYLRGELSLHSNLAAAMAIAEVTGTVPTLAAAAAAIAPDLPALQERATLADGQLDTSRFLYQLREWARHYCAATHPTAVAGSMTPPPSPTGASAAAQTLGL